MNSVFLEFVRHVVHGEIDEASRRLVATPALATAAAEVGAARQGAPDFFFAEIAHYLYAGDTALHMAAAAFRRPIAMLLVAHGADCHAKNRRGAQPLHYAADANQWEPTAQAEIIEYLLSVGADPNALDMSGVAPLRRAVRTRSLPAVRALLDGGTATRPLLFHRHHDSDCRVRRHVGRWVQVPPIAETSVRVPSTDLERRFEHQARSDT